MEEKERMLFHGEIEIPDQVQKKAELAFLQIQNERAKHMEKHEITAMEPEEKKNKGRRTAKSFAAVAACAALIVAAGIGAGGRFGEAPADPGAAGPAVSAVTDPAATAADGSAQTLSRPFVLSVKAEESGEKVALEKSKEVVVSTEMGGWVLDSSEEDGNACSYCIGLRPVTCEGENIDSITYSINKGAFQIVEMKGASIILDGTEPAQPLNTGIIGGGTDEATGEVFPASIKYYTDFTLDYDHQGADTTWINVTAEGVVLSDKALIWGENRTEEDAKKAYEELIDGVVITCTVHFADGTDETVELEGGAALVSAEEPGRASDDPDGKVAVFTLERK